MKLKIALRLESHAILAITEAGGFALTAPELSAFMRKPGHRNYRECKDQVLRHFLKGVQLKYREDSGKQPEEKPKPKPSVWGKRS